MEELTSSQMQSRIDQEVEEILRAFLKALAERLDDRKEALEKLRGRISWPETVGPPALRAYTKLTHQTYEEELVWLRDLATEIRASLDE